MKKIIQCVDNNFGLLDVQGVDSFANSGQCVGVNNASLAPQIQCHQYSPDWSNFCSQSYTNIADSVATVNASKELGMFNVYGAEAFCSNTGGTAFRGIKRKGEENSYFPVMKQRITDERMAAGMNKLHITNDHNYYNTLLFNPENALCTEFISGNCDSSDLPCSDQGAKEQFRTDGQSDKEEGTDYPVFQFTAPLEQFLKKKSDILPPKIVQEICKPCLAVVPWTPPLTTEEGSLTEDPEDGGIKAVPDRSSVPTNIVQNILDDEDVCDEMEL